MLSLFNQTCDVPQAWSEYLAIQNGNGQFISFVAVVAKIKPVYDDWVRCDRIERFEALCGQHGLYCTVESVFEFIENPTGGRQAVGGNKLNTTRAYGHPPQSRLRQGFAHVFVSGDRDALRAAVEHGWYTLVVGERVMEKPWIDHYRLGEYFAYPGCCRRFFAQHNEWNTDNSLFQAARSTSVPNYLCNTLIKNTGLSYAVHLPCSFSCAATCNYARQVQDVVAQISPELVKGIDNLLQRHYLILSEWEIFMFSGSRYNGERLSYSDVWIVPTNRPDEGLYRSLQAGDMLEVDGSILRIFQKGMVTNAILCRSDRFGPQVPMILDFSQ